MGKTCWKCKNIYPDLADTCPKCRLDLDTGRPVEGGDPFKNLGNRPVDIYESTSKLTDHTRPYCPICNLIWSKNAIGRITSCTKCHGRVILKDFNPYGKLLLGLLIIGIGSITLLIKEIPIMWIGGFIWGLSTILYAFQNWSKIQKLDGTDEHKRHFSILPLSIRTYFNKRKFEIIECLSCKQKLRVPRLKKKLCVNCPKCQNSFVLTPTPLLKRFFNFFKVTTSKFAFRSK